MKKLIGEIIKAFRDTKPLDPFCKRVYDEIMDHPEKWSPEKSTSDNTILLSHSDVLLKVSIRKRVILNMFSNIEKWEVTLASSIRDAGITFEGVEADVIAKAAYHMLAVKSEAKLNAWRDEVAEKLNAIDSPVVSE